MAYKTIIIGLFFLLLIQSCKTKNTISYNFDTEYQAQIKERLGYPFGTIVNIEATLIDGFDVPLKAANGVYLLKVSSVNKTKFPTPIIMFFEDRSGKLSTDSLRPKLNEKISLIGYETGTFRGNPNGYENYDIIRNSSLVYGFHNYLIILSKP